MGWTHADVPDQTGRTIVVSGASSGLGLVTARTLAGRGARVVLATRNPAKTDQVMADIRSQHPDAVLEHLEVDLSSLASVRKAAARFLGSHDGLDVLVNNAGVMATPTRTITEDGFELQMATNHLCPFALTGLLLPALLATDGSRVVTVSSGYHMMGRIRFGDLNWAEGYRRWAVYAQTKLANLLFTRELQRRLATAGAPTIAVAAHPGYARTHLQDVAPDMMSGWRQRLNRAVLAATFPFAQDAERGALPQLYAATMPDVTPNSYWGPRFGLQGPPIRFVKAPQAKDDEAARRLWQLSEEMTGVSYALS